MTVTGFLHHKYLYRNSDTRIDCWGPVKFDIMRFAWYVVWWIESIIWYIKTPVTTFKQYFTHCNCTNPEVFPLYLYHDCYSKLQLMMLFVDFPIPYKDNNTTKFCKHTCRYELYTILYGNITKLDGHNLTHSNELCTPLPRDGKSWDVLVSRRIFNVLVVGSDVLVLVLRPNVWILVLRKMSWCRSWSIFYFCNFRTFDQK